MHRENKKDGAPETRRLASHPRMNPLLKGLFFGMALALMAVAAMVWFNLQTTGLHPLQSKTFWLTVACGCSVALAGWKFSTETKLKILLVLLSLGFMELLLQVSGWLALLPAVNTKERLPFGRVYWTSEGLGNSIRNRFGWYYPEFELRKTNRLAVIGDSFVEAVEVHRTRNMSAVLAGRMHGRNETPEVLGLGNHGTGPAQYLEVLQYAHRHFAITDAILVIYLGNDISDCSASLKKVGPERFTYYSLKPDQSLTLDPVSQLSIEEYRRVLESSHRPLWLFAPRLAVSHCMSVQLPLSVHRARDNRRITSQSHAPTNSLDAQLEQLGLHPGPFAVLPSPEVREAMIVLQLLLDRAAEFAREKGIQLRVMTVPFFPPDFYLQSGKEWTARLGNYDFLAPDDALEQWAGQHRIPFLALGKKMRETGLTIKEIQALYLSNGSGHFSEAGHLFTAQAMDSAFFENQSPPLGK